MPSAPRGARPPFEGAPTVSREELASFLHLVPLLEQVPAEHIRRLAARCVVRQYRKGSVVFRRDEPSNWVYFIYQGSVTDIVSYPGSADVITSLHRVGEYIGELGLLIGEPYLNTALAQEDLTLAAMPREGFLELTRQYISVANFLAVQLARRLTKVSRRHVSAMYLDAPARLASTLLAISISDQDEVQRPDISVTQSDLADSVGIARQTVAIILGRWRKLGWIKTERGRLFICDKPALLELISKSEMR